MQGPCLPRFARSSSVRVTARPRRGSPPRGTCSNGAATAARAARPGCGRRTATTVGRHMRRGVAIEPPRRHPPAVRVTDWDRRHRRIPSLASGSPGAPARHCWRTLVRGLRQPSSERTRKSSTHTETERQPPSVDRFRSTLANHRHEQAPARYPSRRKRATCRCPGRCSARLQPDVRRHEAPHLRGFYLSGRPDLNRGPHRPERCALPGCATPRMGPSIPQAPGLPASQATLGDMNVDVQVAGCGHALKRCGSRPRRHHANVGALMCSRSGPSAMPLELVRPLPEGRAVVVLGRGRR